MKSRRNLAIAIKTRVAARVCQTFYFVPFGNSHHAKVGIAISSPDFKIEPGFLQSVCNPILEMEFLVLSAFSFNKDMIIDGQNAFGEQA
jgi:hypothetical protein